MIIEVVKKKDMIGNREIVFTKIIFYYFLR